MKDEGVGVGEAVGVGVGEGEGEGEEGERSTSDSDELGSMGRFDAPMADGRSERLPRHR